MASVFDNITPNPQAGYQWYQREIRKLRNVRGQTERMMTASGQLVSKIVPGRMYLFHYDPKHKDTLPYYDMFPLVLPYRIIPDGFYGLNLHYLPYLMRFKILSKLDEFTNNDKYDITTKVRLSWALLTSVSTLKPLQACVKHYLANHVQSRFLNIAYPDWVTASQLPVEQFVGATKTAVWKDSSRKY